MTWWAHRRMRQAVSAYVDGELDVHRSARVAAHLRDCSGCSGDVELTRVIKQSLLNLGHRRRETLAVMRLQRFATRLTNG